MTAPSHRSQFPAAAAVAIALGLSPGAARAQIARVELHTFASATLTDEEFLTGKGEGKPVVVAGELRIPTPGTDRLPAVILAHGSGGVSGYVDDWVRRLNAMHVATFVFDSFTPRGIANTVEDQAQLGRLAMIVDLYRALGVLARHPRVDPSRIAVMGFSRGGAAALYSSLERFRRMHAPPDASFAMYVVFYPPCTTRYLRDEEVADRPIRIFHGVADDFAPVTATRAYVDRLRRAGKDVRLTEYPGASHVFDWAALAKPARMARAQNAGACRLDEVSEGRVVDVETKRPFTYQDPCVHRGATLAYDAAADADAQRAVAELVRTVLRPP